MRPEAASFAEHCEAVQAVKQFAAGYWMTSNELERSEIELQEAKQQIACLKRTNQHLCNVVQEADARHVILTKTNHDFGSEFAKLQAENGRLQEENGNLRFEGHSITLNKIDHLAEEIAAKTKRLVEQGEKIRARDRQIQELQKELEQLRQHIGRDADLTVPGVEIMPQAIRAIRPKLVGMKIRDDSFAGGWHANIQTDVLEVMIEF